MYLCFTPFFCRAKKGDMPMGKDLKGREIGKGISQRKNLSYIGRFVDKKGKRQTFYDKNLKQLIKKLEKARYESEHGIYGTGEDVTLAEWFEVFLVEYKAGRVKLTTLYRIQQTFDLCQNGSLNKTKLRELRALQIQELINELHARGCTYGTIKQLKYLLSEMFRIAIGNGLMVINPCDAVILPKEEECEEAVLTQEELDTFLAAASGFRHYRIFCIQVSTGMRIGEVLGLKWSDIDFEKKTITISRSLHYGKLSKSEKCHFFFDSVKTKSSNRTIPLLPETEKVLKKVREKQYVERGENRKIWKQEEPFEDLVFTTSSGTPVTCGDVNRTIKKVIAKVNSSEIELAKLENREPHLLPDFSTHCFRHTFVTLCKKYGIPYEHIQLYVGHSEKEMTKYYDHNKVVVTTEDFKNMSVLNHGVELE